MLSIHKNVYGWFYRLNFLLQYVQNFKVRNKLAFLINSLNFSTQILSVCTNHIENDE